MSTAPWTLYSYYRSSASWRVRIALNLKGLAYDYRAVHLVEGGGQQLQPAYRAVNPMAEVPTLVIVGAAKDGGTLVLAQSVAILEYLEETHPEPALLPAHPAERAQVRQLVEGVNASIQPVQNLRVLKDLTAQFGADQDARVVWGRNVIARGFRAMEAMLAKTAGVHAFGDSITWADIVLVPQIYNARRFGVDLDEMPTITRICAAADALDAFHRATPNQQPDAPA